MPLDLLQSNLEAASEPRFHLSCIKLFSIFNIPLLDCFDTIMIFLFVIFINYHYFEPKLCCLLGENSWKLPSQEQLDLCVGNASGLTALTIVGVT